VKSEHKFVILSVIFGLAIWVLDAVEDYYYYRAPTFGWALTGAPTNELILRVAALIGFVIFGLLVSNATARRRHLEEILQQRNHELTLVNAELQARNEELDAFAHTVAHDLRSCLTPIFGFADTLDSEHASLSREEAHSFLQSIVHSVQKMDNVIEELLLLASVRKAQGLIAPLDMTEIVALAQHRLAAMIEENQVEIILREASAWPVALGYGPWIEGVWVNYLSNAIKYGGRPPRVEMGATEQPDDMIRFWVHDNGAGLSQDEQAQLFTPFTRLDQVRAKGHGLGLSIVRRIVEKLGGQVGVESDDVPGRGSVFFFTLPSAVKATDTLPPRN
jgi:signal transduction histidine kinase